jgi:adenosylhomocysteine nucleosidase
MLLRWLLNTYLKQAAQEKIMEAVVEAARGSARKTSGAEGDETQPPPPCEIVFLFALEIESGGLVDLLSEAETTRYPTFLERAGYLNGRRVAVIEGGVGRNCAARAAADAITVHRPQWVVSAGFAGALVDELRRGHFLLADSVASEDGKSFEIGLRTASDAVARPNWHVGRLVTVDKVIRREKERRELAEAHRAIACDMETFAIAEVCAQEKTRLISVRIVSDAVGDRIPKEIERLLTRKSLAAKLGAAVGALLDRPSSVKDLWRLREQALAASDRLARFLVGVADQLPEALAPEKSEPI